MFLCKTQLAFSICCSHTHTNTHTSTVHTVLSITINCMTCSPNPCVKLPCKTAHSLRPAPSMLLIYSLLLICSPFSLFVSAVHGFVQHCTKYVPQEECCRMCDMHFPKVLSVRARGQVWKKHKIAALYERRSMGNRWYRSKTDTPSLFTTASRPIRVYSHEPDIHLGHKINIAGE